MIYISQQLSVNLVVKRDLLRKTSFGNENIYLNMSDCK